MSKKYLILLALLLIVVFYWFEIRPASIRSDCMKKATDEAVTSITDEREPNTYKRGKMQEEYITNAYKDCLHEKGLAE